MADSFTETTTQSWGSRLKGSLSSVVSGASLILCSIGILCYNEGNLVAARAALKESESICNVVPTINKIDPSLEGSLVYLTGFADTESTAEDKTFGVSLRDTLKIQRSVELYQWVEHKTTKTKKKTGGSTVTDTTYTYDKEWSSFLRDSKEFEYPDGHRNPQGLPFESSVSLASKIDLGAFLLTEDVTNKLNEYVPLSVPPSIEDIPAEIKRGNKTIAPYSQNGLYIGTGKQEDPIVGDVRVTFTRVPTQTISVIAKQTGSSLSDYVTSNGRDILLVEKGAKSMDYMFDEAQKDQTRLAWLIRGICFLVIWVGLTMIASPLSTFADVLPILGNCVGSLVAAINGVVALCISLVTIALAWLWFRPFFSLCAFGFVGIVLFGLSKLGKANKTKGEEEISLAGDSEAAKVYYTDSVVV